MLDRVPFQWFLGCFLPRNHQIPAWTSPFIPTGPIDIRVDDTVPKSRYGTDAIPWERNAVRVPDICKSAEDLPIQGRAGRLSTASNSRAFRCSTRNANGGIPHDRQQLPASHNDRTPDQEWQTGAVNMTSTTWKMGRYHENTAMQNCSLFGPGAAR
jgi:hypothetical protein